MKGFISWTHQHKERRAITLFLLGLYYLCFMAEEQFKAFLDKAQGDTCLQEKLKAAADSDAVLRLRKKQDSVFQLMT